MFIQTEATPNPDTVKFLPGLPVAGFHGPFDYPDAASAKASLLARALFQVDGVERVFLGADFVSISKASARDWKHVKPMVLAAIMDHYMAGLPVVDTSEKSEEDETAYEGETAEIVNEIKELLETRIRPAVAQDGGDITFRSFDPETGIVHLNMRGACAGCPSSTQTLKMGIENMLRTYVPEVTAVEAVI
jgi:NFU1 iron-sulfur cluster scaffold homolog, mitochondrial